MKNYQNETEETPPSEDSILDNLIFDDELILHCAHNEIFQNEGSSPLFFKKISYFNSIMVPLKILHKLNHISIDHNGLPNENITSSIKLVQVMSMMTLFKSKYFTKINSSNDNQQLDVEKNLNINLNHFIHQIYKILISDNSDENAKQCYELDALVHYLLSDYFGADVITSFEKFKGAIDGNSLINLNIVQLSSPNIMKSQPSYDNFQKYFKLLLKFFLYCDKYKQIFDILEAKEKIMTAELIIALNKIVRELDGNNIFSIFTKKFLELVDATQIYLKKSEFFFLLLRSLII